MEFRRSKRRITRDMDADSVIPYGDAFQCYEYAYIEHRGGSANRFVYRIMPPAPPTVQYSYRYGKEALPLAPSLDCKLAFLRNRKEQETSAENDLHIWRAIRITYIQYFDSTFTYSQSL